MASRASRRSTPSGGFPGGETFAAQRERVLLGIEDWRSRARCAARARRLPRQHDPARARSAEARAAERRAARQREPRGAVTRLSQILFGVLVAASLAAFFVAQELKSQPSLIQDFQLAWRVISPNADSRNDAQRVRFRLKEADTVDVAIVDADGDEVREILSGASLPAYRYPQPTPSWDGRDDSGDPAPDGVYRVRITLRDHGRNVIVPDSFRVDRTPPDVRIVAIGPDPGPRPEILPTHTRGPARIRLNAPVRSARARMLFFRTDVTPARLAAQRVDPGRVDRRALERDRRRRSSGRARHVPRRRRGPRRRGQHRDLDAARPPRPAASGLRPQAPGPRRDHRPRLAAQPPLAAGRAGGPRIGLLVDARGRPYDWSVRRVGGATIRRGRANRPQVALKPPGSDSGVYLFEAARGAHRAAVPFAVDDARSPPRARRPAADDVAGTQPRRRRRRRPAERARTGHGAKLAPGPRAAAAGDVRGTRGADADLPRPPPASLRRDDRRRARAAARPAARGPHAAC